MNVNDVREWLNMRTGRNIKVGLRTSANTAYPAQVEITFLTKEDAELAAIPLQQSGQFKGFKRVGELWAVAFEGDSE